jgi:hypothetical protein
MNHAAQIYMARVLLAQARHSRQHPAWHATLLQWAAMRRRRAAGEALLGNQPQAQGELFDDTAGGKDAKEFQKPRTGQAISRRGPGRHGRHSAKGGKKGGHGNCGKAHQKTAPARQSEKR